MPFNLRAAANSVTHVINPNVTGTLFISTGNTIVDHRQVPQYDKFSIVAQVQPLSSKDLRQLDALNIQSAEKTIFINGSALGIVRIKNRGGDLIVFPEGTLAEGNTWLILASLEQWGASTWAKVSVILQDDIPDPS